MTSPNPEFHAERVLVLAPTGRDAHLTQVTLAHADVNAEVCADVGELCRALRVGAGAVVLAEESLNAAAIGELAHELESQPAWSEPPLILFAIRGAGTGGIQKAVSLLGARANITVLERPIDRFTLVSAARAALAARRRQYQVRDLLARLARSVEERDRFLAILSHELRNPLGTILAALELTERTGAGQDEQRQIIARQARQLSRLVDDLLDVSRVTAGKIVLQKSTVDLVQVVQRSAEASRVAISNCRHQLNLTLTPEPLSVYGDPVRLEQVFTNLLTNAVKYTPPGGHLWVTAAAEDAQAVITVRDDGIGLSAESLARLFQPFMQVDDSLDRSQGGLGLGLALVRSLVEMHGGTVSAASAGLGMGTEFTVRLPRTQVPASTERERPANKRTASRRVLLVEDGADARRALQRLLAVWGHEVDVAEDGMKGVDLAIARRPEVALVDIGLPGLSGYEVARRVRQALGSSICLIALTGYGQPEDRQRTRDAGFDMHLVKPVEPTRLEALLAGDLPPGQPCS